MVKYPTWFGAYGDRLWGEMGTRIRMQAQTMKYGSKIDEGLILYEQYYFEQGLSKR